MLNDEVENVATPAVSVPVPSEVVPSKKVTAPPPADGLTVAVNATAAPLMKLEPDVVNVVVVEAGGVGVGVPLVPPQPDSSTAPTRRVERRREWPGIFTELEDSKRAFPDGY